MFQVLDKSPFILKTKSTGQTVHNISHIKYSPFQSLLPAFLLNGFETVELFRQLDEDDLDHLGILDPEDRAKVLTAVKLLPDEEEEERGVQLAESESGFLCICVTWSQVNVLCVIRHKLAHALSATSDHGSPIRPCWPNQMNDMNAVITHFNKELWRAGVVIVVKGKYVTLL